MQQTSCSSTRPTAHCPSRPRRGSSPGSFLSSGSGCHPKPPSKAWEVKLAPANAVDWMSQPMRSVLALEGLKSHVAAPLRVADKILGVLEVFSRDDISADEEWVSFLETMADHAAVAVESAEMAIAVRRAEPSRSVRRVSRPELNDREVRILRLLVDGATNREVGEQLHLSHNTIKFHIRQLLQKAGVSNRTELATRAALQGWV